MFEKTMVRTLLAAAVALLLATGADQACADIMTVTLTGTYPASIVGTAPMYADASFSLQFQVETNPVPPVYVESDSAFVAPITANYCDNGTSSVLTGTAGYFNYVDQGYTGVDLRIGPWETDSMMQIIFVSPDPLFTGPTTNPTLSVIEADGNGCGFYPNGSSDYGSFQAVESHYASSVPEPSTLALLGVGAIGLLAYAWRRRRAKA